MSFSGDQTHEAEIPREWSVSQVPWDPSHECQFLPVVASPSTHNTWYLTTLPEPELRPKIDLPFVSIISTLPSRYSDNPR